MKIKRICLFGGPGCGKSTISAYIFSQLKIKGYNIELVREYIKDWSYLKRIPTQFEQLYIFAKQLQSEDLLLRNSVDLIITDSPIFLSYIYSQKYSCPFQEQILSMIKIYEEAYPSLNIFLDRENLDYHTIGRYETLTEAIKIDKDIKELLHNNNINFKSINSTDLKQIMEFIEQNS